MVENTKKNKQTQDTPDRESVIRACFEKWLQPLGLLWWKVDILYYDDPSEILKHFHVDDDSITLARSYSDWRYGTAKVIINLPALAELSPDEIETVIVHELVHVLVNEMREGELHHEERVVSCLTKAFLWTREAGKKDNLHQ